ncbi:uncharacterized protein TRIADDRAFT_57401 [Trichoplax adhaerens]|uniref:EDR1/CTR1/ARMC3-like peptidase-like domain-containing protein n=1 Tax=Trichoplax adhaerens TaxID=10228 RepID=B3RZC4_TRIAD|nr:hypothetical protein TRIADDRAFT_57401 [Trichoplax adhaerens]EDV23819.1 hypothetical protein TRIADDRAFT_57401 [Trichoplax adhaerens]|eukprot:XP_002113345.1 hypothetical protein TRIADDRAFT_57401 [Trichoplax adhaerens]
MPSKVKKKDHNEIQNNEFDPVNLISKNPRTVVLMLDSPEETVLASACEAIYKFAEKSDANKIELLNTGVINGLNRLLSLDDKAVRTHAAACLGTLTGHAEIRKALRKTNCIEPLIALIQPEEELICHDHASLALCHLAADFTSKLEIFEKNGLQPLIKLLTSIDSDVQKNAAEAICYMVQDYQSRLAIRDLHADNRAAIREVGGMEKLVDFIGNKDFEDLHVNCMAIISNCLEDHECMKLMQNNRGLEKLLAFTVDSTSHAMQQRAARAVGNAAKNAENRKIFREIESEKQIITLFASDNIGVQAATARALALMAENSGSREAIGHFDGVPPLISLLNNENVEARTFASLALANMTSSHTKNCSLVVQANGIEPLIALLNDHKFEPQANAAVCLTNIAADEGYRAEIQRQGVVQSLVNALQSINNTVQAKATLAVAALVCDTETRTELRNYSGCERIVALLKSDNDQVRRCACWTINSCGNDLPTATDFCKHGALEILQDIATSNTRQSRFAKAALDCLLNCNLSAKYSLNNEISAQNFIQDGFYDAGQLRQGRPFLSLEEFSKSPIDAKRPYLLVYTKNPIRKVETPVTQPTSEKKHSSRRRDGRSKMRSREQKEREETAREEEQQLLLQQQLEEERKAAAGEWRPNYDAILANYIQEAQKNIQTLPNTREQVIALAKSVSDKMGGVIEKANLAGFGYELHINQLKYELKSNIIPLGSISMGTFYHRALLFKVVADRIGISTSLIRGKYTRAWNEVLISDDPEPGQPRYPPKKYIVDLIHQPGQLLLIDSMEAKKYCRL